MIWFTSDTHFGHANVLNFTDRRWETVEQMSSALVGAINARVAPADELYILGDFSFKMTAREAAALRDRIVCRKVHLVPGNHDKDWTHKDVAGTFIVEPPIVRLNIHSPGALYNELNRAQGLARYDVGVDANGYAPVSLDELRAWFEGVETPTRVRWWDWVNGTDDPGIAEVCERVRAVVREPERGYASAQESAEAARANAAALRDLA